MASDNSDFRKCIFLSNIVQRRAAGSSFYTSHTELPGLGEISVHRSNCFDHPGLYFTEIAANFKRKYPFDSKNSPCSNNNSSRCRSKGAGILLQRSRLE